MGNIFFDITIITGLAAILSIVFRILKQPAILAYILTGIILGPFAVAKINNPEVVRSLSEIGITLLLFMVGLELRFSELKAVGKVALLTGIGQIVFTSIIGFFISLMLGFEAIPSLYISIALTFSSTIIIVKLLSDKRDLKSLYGKISVGFLLVQDFVAILALIFLSGFNTAGSSMNPMDFVWVITKGILIFAGVIYLSRAILPKIVEKIPHNSETLFLFSLAWAFALSYIIASKPIGFSIEIGGFLAGLALANSVESFQIVARVKPLRDFFITIFFVSLGTGLILENFSQIIIPALIFSLFILIGNPIIVMIIIGILGYKKRIGFLAGLTVAQISEFSLILVFLGNKLGHLSDEVVSLVTLVGIVTFTISSYMILNGNYLYKILSPYLGIFERKKLRGDNIITSDGFEDLENHVVIVGGEHMGQSIIEALESKGEKLVVIDFDPSLINHLKNQNLQYLFGDISDLDIQEKAKIRKAKLVVSTIPDLEDNSILLKELKTENRRAKVIMMAFDTHDARQLYKEGADYVILPHLAGGRQVAKILSEGDLEKLEILKEKDKRYLS
ncbi:MAG: sodium:proton exchanger [Candidatus Levybacteria bacterium CG10_big_fil_rev_8_21_14_0_10_35_13]|nr:MAG: sodium:proton exchanger [Candidatus Levybacteria bacterium CG10_big_fil_rev_8_21_14_0_10_35_13]